MQLKSLLLSFTLGLFSITAMAGSGHDHGHSHSNTPVDQVTAKAKATEIVAAFVERNKLDKSWASVTVSSVEKKEFKGSSEWVAVFVNKEVPDTNKQKLYVFLTLSGDYIAVNHTGK
jgi:hypothetical protein